LNLSNIVQTFLLDATVFVDSDQKVILKCPSFKEHMNDTQWFYTNVDAVYTLKGIEGIQEVVDTINYTLETYIK
jgi:hypothetical protein